jgi:hypothetical protein
MKISNTTQHLTGGVIAAFACLILLINLSVSARVPAGWLLIIAWGGITAGWEYYQYLKGGSKPYYWEYRGKDTICDLLAGNVPVWVLCIVGMYGQSVIGVMR